MKYWQKIWEADIGNKTFHADFYCTCSSVVWAGLAITPVLLYWPPPPPRVVNKAKKSTVYGLVGNTKDILVILGALRCYICAEIALGGGEVLGSVWWLSAHKERKKERANTGQLVSVGLLYQGQLKSLLVWALTKVPLP